LTFEDSDRSLIKHFRRLEDPRDSAKARHNLRDLLAISVAAVICGADDWVSIADFWRAKEAWLRGFLDLSNGIPSHDTFGRVFSVLGRKQGRTTNLRKLAKVRLGSVLLGCRRPYILMVAGCAAGSEGYRRLASVGRRS